MRILRLRRCRVLLLALPALLALAVALPPALHALRPARLPEPLQVSPASARPGTLVRLTFEGRRLDKITQLLATCPVSAWKVVPPSLAEWFSLRRQRRVRIDVVFAAEAKPGGYQLQLRNRAGASGPVGFTLEGPRAARPVPAPPPEPDALPPDAIAEVEPNDYPRLDHPLALPLKVVGRFDREGDVDSYCFRASAGEEVGVRLLPWHGPEPRAQLLLTDEHGRCLAESSSGVLGHRCAEAGTYVLRLHDWKFRGDPSLRYLLEVGRVPVITAVYPLGLRRGTEAAIRLDGVNLGPSPTLHVQAPADAAAGAELPLAFATPHGPALTDRRLAVGEYPEVQPAVSESPGSDGLGTLPVPGTANGRVLGPAGDLWRVHARRGQRLVLEVHAARLGSPLDSVLEVLDDQGRPVPRAVLRAVARTYTDVDMEGQFDSETDYLGVSDWSELRFNDYLFIGSELVRIRSTPNHAGDRCRFYTVDGKRATYLDTTPTHHDRTDVPVYKVEVHPPGTTFPAGSLPVFAIPYRNDDGGPYCGKDSRLSFDPPADGDYLVRVADAHGRGGPAFGYRLTAHPPRPDFLLRVPGEDLTGQTGGAVAVKVVAERVDGFNGPIEIHVEGLPPGFRALPAVIPPDEDNTTFAVHCDPGAAWPADAPLRLVARATVDGQMETRTATARTPKLAEPGSLSARAEQRELVIEPGGRAELTIRLTRRNGFTDRVWIEPRGLPPGIVIQDLGVNGVIIPEQQSSRTIAFQAEPGVGAMTQPFVMQVYHETFQTTPIAVPVLLKIVPKGRVIRPRTLGRQTGHAAFAVTGAASAVRAFAAARPSSTNPAPSTASSNP